MDKRELRYAATWAAWFMALTCLPYLIAWGYGWVNHPYDLFPGLLFNLDDHGAYFAWIRQGADGHLLFRNLFTNDPQRGVYFHLYFLVLGWVARLIGVSLACHLGRVVSGMVVLVLVYRLAAFFTSDVFTRRLVLWTTAFAAGLGWLFWQDKIEFNYPVDTWQSEAITFTSLYCNGLFAVSLALMLGVVVCLLLAEERGWRWAVGAGLCGLALGNIHSYDMIHLAAAWGGYLVARAAVERRVPWTALGHAVLAAVVAAPSVAYMYWFYKTEPIFKARADVPTLSESIRYYFLGYGLLIPLALFGMALLWRRKELGPRRLLPIVWAVTGLAVAYAPFKFQRKMIMGEHLPLALLAALALAELLSRAAVLQQRPQLRRVMPALVVAFLALSPLRWVMRDLKSAIGSNLTSSGLHPAYWPESIIQAYRWLGGHSERNAVLLAYPITAVLAPGYSGRAVYSGHWGETPHFGDRFPLVASLYNGKINSRDRQAFFQANGIRYVLVGPYERELFRPVVQPLAPPLEQEPFLTPVFSAGEGDNRAVLYEVRPSAPRS